MCEGDVEGEEEEEEEKKDDVKVICICHCHLVEMCVKVTLPLVSTALTVSPPHT